MHIIKNFFKPTSYKIILFLVFCIPLATMFVMSFIPSCSSIEYCSSSPVWQTIIKLFMITTQILAIPVMPFQALLLALFIKSVSYLSSGLGIPFVVLVYLNVFIQIVINYITASVIVVIYEKIIAMLEKKKAEKETPSLFS